MHTSHLTPHSRSQEARDPKKAARRTRATMDDTEGDGAGGASAPAPAEEQGATSQPRPQPPNGRRRPLPVDRSWISSLLAAHAHTLDPEWPTVADPILRNKALVVAPMVDQSDLPFRLLARRYGCNLAYTPMIHARMFADRPMYRQKFWNFVDGMPREDRPLIAQFCGSDPDGMLEAMRLVQGHVDGVDINCGCPQGIARRGKYGAYLLENPNLPALVRHLAANLDVPVCVKVRLLPSGLEDSLDLYERLVDAGAHLITVHGRNRHQKGHQTGEADWDAIRRTVERIGHRVPVFANGAVACLDDVRECIRSTGVDGVMSSEAILEYPALFLETGTLAAGGRRTGPGRVRLAKEFLELCRRHPPEVGGQGSGLKCIRSHLHHMLHADLQVDTEIRDLVAFYGKSMEVLEGAVEKLERMQVDRGHKVEDEVLTWYLRHRQNEGDGDDENKAANQNSAGTGAGTGAGSEGVSDDPMSDDEPEGGFSNNLFGDDGEQCGCVDDGDY